jgi:hypothetical protein
MSFKMERHERQAYKAFVKVFKPALRKFIKDAEWDDGCRPAKVTILFDDRPEIVIVYTK